MLTWMRYQLGVVPAPEEKKKPSAAVERKLAAANASADAGESQEVRLQRMVTAQQVKLEGVREEIAEYNAESVALVKRAQDPKTPPNVRAQCVADAKVILTKCAEKRQELDTAEKKLHNLRGQLSVLQTASSNLEHAILIQQGADELEATMAAMETLQIEDNVDRLRDAAATVQDHNALLTEDMGLSGNPMAGAAQEYLIDEELDALMRAQHDTELDALLGQIPQTPTPTAPQPSSAPGLVAQSGNVVE